jgi:hypothetical protein
VLKAPEGKALQRVLARWRSAQGPLLFLLAAGFIFAAGSSSFSKTYSSDVTLYEYYAKAALASPLLHSFPKEYPGIALGVFVAPLALPTTYTVGFALLAAVATVALVLSSDGFPGQPGWSRRTCYYLLIGTVALVFARYDVFPALAALLAVEGARKGQWNRAWSWAVLGGCLKLFPFLLLPGFLLVERAQTGKWPLKRAGIAAASVVIIVAVQLVTAPQSLLSPIEYQLHRGFELSSLQGSLAFLADPLHVRWVSGFGSVEVVGAGHLVISTLVTAAAGGAFAFIWVLARRGQLSVVAVSLAVFSVAVLAEKSFAPQYLVWLAPLWAYWPMRRSWVLAALLSTLIYPLLYGEAHAWGPSMYLPTAVAVVRNGVLVVATATWFVQELRVRRKAPDGASEKRLAQRLAGALDRPAAAG